MHLLFGTVPDVHTCRIPLLKLEGNDYTRTGRFSAAISESSRSGILGSERIDIAPDREYSMIERVI